jgi:hypothetical protein
MRILPITPFIIPIPKVLTVGIGDDVDNGEGALTGGDTKAKGDVTGARILILGDMIGVDVVAGFSVRSSHSVGGLSLTIQS